MILTNTESVPGKEIVQFFGMVSGSTVRAKHIGRDLMAMMVALGAGGSAAQLAGFAGELTQRGFDREQESAADRVALGIVAAEYGHLRGADDFLRKTPKYEGRFDPRLNGYLSTHPLDAERLAALEALAAERGWSAQGELTPLSD